MQFGFFLLLPSLSFSALLHASSPAAAQAPPLGSARGFAVLGATTVTNTGASTVTGDLGVAPGTAITGFPPGFVTGAIHTGDAAALQAQSDLTTAYDALAGAACTVVMTGQDLGGLTLTPGVYCFAASAPLNGALQLDAQGNPDAVFIFQIGSTLLAALNSSVTVINGGRDANVYWQVGSSATLAAGTAFSGNIIALASITLSSGSTVSGRALARTGAVTMDTSSVSLPPGNGCGTQSTVVQLMSGCGVPSAPVLTCSPTVQGQPVRLDLNWSRGNARAFILISQFGGPTARLEGCNVLVSPTSFVLGAFMTDGNGDNSIIRNIPNAPSLCGSRWVVQGVIVDPSGTPKFAISNALLTTLGN